MAAILVTRPGPLEHTFVRPLQWGSTLHLALIGYGDTEKKKFENIKSEWLGDLWYS